MKKTAIILGSTGLTGSHLLQLLLKSDIYERVISFVRKSSGVKHPKLSEQVVDFDNEESYKPLIEGNDMFCCLGTTIKKAGSQEAFEQVDFVYPTHFAKIAAEKGIKQYLIISALGANPQSSNFYMRTKGKCEEELRQIAFQSTSIFRPSLLLGNRHELRIGEKIGEYMMKVLSVFLIGRLKKYRAIKAKKVAYAMFAVAQQNTVGYHIYESDQISEIFALGNK